MDWNDTILDDLSQPFISVLCPIFSPPSQVAGCYQWDQTRHCIGWITGKRGGTYCDGYTACTRNQTWKNEGRRGSENLSHLCRPSRSHKWVKICRRYCISSSSSSSSCRIVGEGGGGDQLWGKIGVCVCGCVCVCVCVCDVCLCLCPVLFPLVSPPAVVVHNLTMKPTY